MDVHLLIHQMNRTPHCAMCNSELITMDTLLDNGAGNMPANEYWCTTCKQTNSESNIEFHNFGVSLAASISRDK